MVKKIFLLLTLFSLVTLSRESLCQVDSQIDKDSTYKLDEFPSGLMNLKFNKISTNIIFPLEALENEVYEGFVYCSFKINEVGQLYDINAFRYSNEVFVKNALKYFNELRVAVDTVQINVTYQLKLNFKIE